MRVNLTSGSADDEQIVANMFTAFFYDLSQYDDNLVINRYGLPTWAPSGLPGPRTHEACAQHNWWIRDRCMRYAIRADGDPAGFLNICADKGHLSPGVNYELLDFYIAPKYRRRGIGRLAARAAFDMFHGVWQVFELARNAPALAFWHAVIGEYTGGQYQDLDDGTQQRFQN
jgi:predicted acetyltransferase